MFFFQLKMYSDFGGKEILTVVKYFFMCIPKTSPPKFFYIPKYNCDVVLSVKYRWYLRDLQSSLFSGGPCTGTAHASLTTPTKRSCDSGTCFVGVDKLGFA